MTPRIALCNFFFFLNVQQRSEKYFPSNLPRPEGRAFFPQNSRGQQKSRTGFPAVLPRLVRVEWLSSALRGHTGLNGALRGCGSPRPCRDFIVRLGNLLKFGDESYGWGHAGFYTAVRYLFAARGLQRSLQLPGHLSGEGVRQRFAAGGTPALQ